MKEKLIDLIYEASVVPELWPDLLEELGSATDAKGGMLIAARDRVLNWTASDEVHDAFEAYVTDGWFRRCGRRICLFTQADASFLTELDYWSEEELAENEIYRDFFHPRDLGWSAGTGLTVPTGDHIVCSIERAFSAGPMEKQKLELLNELRPHLARSAVISSRLGLKSAQNAKDTFAGLGVPTILLAADGRIVDKGNITDEISDCLQTGAGDRLAFTDLKATGLLQDAMQTLSESSELTGRSFPVRDEHGQAQLVAHILPINRTANDIFGNAYALLVLIPLDSKAAPPVDLVRSLFDFTAAEAKVARELARGSSLEHIAESQGVSINTIRTHLRKVMEKTGSSRQPELVSLLSNISLER